MATAQKTYQCGCGVWLGERCLWTGTSADMVVVEWMPPELRASHIAAGNRGAYPCNGAVRVAVERSCADLLMESEDESRWAAVRPDLDPAGYAEAVETAEAVGRRIGRAMARDVVAEDMPREWTGLDPQDADHVPDGIDPSEVEERARRAYREALGAGAGSGAGGCGALDRDGIQECLLTAGHAGRHRSPWGTF